jgi:glyoxylase-like metal-dependent hydrolase (beta-lactamase superfamily II)
VTASPRSSTWTSAWPSSASARRASTSWSSPTGPPATPAAIVNDLSQWYASVEKLRGIAEQSNAKVIFGHDAEQLWSLRRSPDGHYT